MNNIKVIFKILSDLLFRVKFSLIKNQKSTKPDKKSEKYIKKVFNGDFLADLDFTTSESLSDSIRNKIKSNKETS